MLLRPCAPLRNTCLTVFCLVGIACWCAVAGAESREADPPATTQTKTADSPADDKKSITPINIDLPADASISDPNQPRFVVVLLDGTKLRGRLLNESFAIETRFGKLTVPLAKFISLRCGTNTLAHRKQRVEALIQQLGNEDFKQRESAQEQLKLIGPRIVRLLEDARSHDNTETATRVKDLLEHFDKLRNQFGVEAIAPWTDKDELINDEFRTNGTLVSQTVVIEGFFGKLNLPLEHIDHIRRIQKQAGAAAYANLNVKGTHLVQHKAMRTKIKVTRGDRIMIRASGTIVRSTSSSYTSTPDGSSRFGYYYMKGDRVYGGTLLARVGSRGKWHRIGSNGTFTATNEGELQFAVSMSDSYASRYQFNGDYKVAVRVER